jgi:hypothetical protein
MNDEEIRLNLTDPEARRALAQVYRLLLDLATEAEVPTDSGKTRASPGDEIRRPEPSRDSEQPEAPAQL